MLGDKMVTVVLPTTDMERSEKFYTETLGLKKEWGMAGNILLAAGGDTKILVYEKTGGTKADHTVAGFNVENLEKEMAELREKGVVFEEYTVAEVGFETENGVAVMDGIESAWFKDPDGNILNIVEM